MASSKSNNFGDFTMVDLITFAHGPVHMEIFPGAITDGAGQVTVPSGANSGSNAGASVLNAIRAGMVPIAPKTAGFNAAVTAATTAIASVSDAPTKAALTAILAAASALTSA
jgi:hypothetical protein